MMPIFFVFDTSFCKSEEDDPKDALVYFYPLEICDVQKHELCFQLVGISQFLKSTFTSPVVVSLDQGKFAFYRSQNYLLVLGGRSIVNSSILKEQLEYLCRVFAFYLKDVNSVLNICENNRLLFLQKMKEMWNHILPTSSLFGNISTIMSSIIPVAAFSQKDSSGICSRAKQLLHVCQRNAPVIAGAIFCEKQLVYSQLIPEVTKNLMLLLSFQDCAALCNAQIAYRLPPGVKMKSVYLTRREISSILKHNHMSVGSQIRYHHHKKMYVSQCSTTSLSSGSEGDVDSGNSSEGTEARKSDSSTFASDAHSQSKPEYSVVCNSAKLESGSSYHYSPFHKNKVVDKNLERCISTDTERSYSTAYESAPGNMFDHCRRHSQYLDPTDGTLWKYTSLQRRHSFSCASNFLENTKKMFHDNEFCLRTSSCRLFECRGRCDTSISRQWTPKELPHFSPRTMQGVCTLLRCCCYLCLIKNHNLASEVQHKGAEKKLQILKCRLSKRRNKNYNHSTQSSKYRMDENSQKVCSSHRSATVNPTQNVKKSSTVGSTHDLSFTKSCERQEMFLYIQRYCSCTLFLLLNNSFDEELLNDLWMYGFCDLGEIELEAKKCILSADDEKKTDFEIYVFDSVLHELAGKVPRVNISTDDGIHDTTLQMVHFDLQSNASLQSVSVLSQSRSLLGYHTQHNELYYIQPGTVNTGSEISSRRQHFTQLYKKAKHRIKKYFGASLAEF